MDEEKVGALLELERRGKLPPDRASAISELRRRGRFPAALGSPISEGGGRVVQAPPPIAPPQASQDPTEPSGVLFPVADYARPGPPSWIPPSELYMKGGRRPPKPVDDIPFEGPNAPPGLTGPIGSTTGGGFIPGPLDLLEAGGAAVASLVLSDSYSMDRAKALLRGEGENFPARHPLIESIPGLAVAAGGAPVLVGAEDVLLNIPAVAKGVKGVMKAGKGVEKGVEGISMKFTPASTTFPSEDLSVKAVAGAVPPSVIPDQTIKAVIGDVQSIPEPKAGQKALDAVTNLRLALDKRLSDDVAKPFFDDMWEMLPEGAKKFLAQSVKSSADKAEPVLAQMLRDAHLAAQNEEIVGMAAGKRLAVSMRAVGLKKGSDGARDLYRYIGGESVEPTVTLYRYEPISGGKKVPEWIKANEGVSGTPEHGAKEATGRWFTETPDEFYKKQIEDAGLKPRLVSKKVRASSVENYRVSNLPGEHEARKFSRRPKEEFFLPKETLDEGGNLWPSLLPRALKGPADQVKGQILDALKEGQDLKIVSAENVQEHMDGLLSRYYDNVRAEYGFKNSHNSAKLDDLYLRNDAWGGVINAPLSEVESVLKGMGVDPSALPYIKEIDGVTAVKIGTDDASRSMKEALKAQFPKGWESDLRPLSIADRAAMAERMDPVEAVARTYAGMKARNTVARLQKGIAEKFSEAPLKGARGGSYAPEGKVLVPDDHKWGELRNRVLPKEIYDQLQGVVEYTDDLGEGIAGFTAAAKGDLTGQIPTAVVNAATNAVYSFADGLSVLDPGGYKSWGQAVKDLWDLRTKGIISPRLKASMDAGVNIKGVTGDMLGEADGLLQAMTRTPMTSRNRGKLLFQLASGSPNLAIKGLSPWTNRAISTVWGGAVGAGYGAAVGGIPGMLAGGAVGLASSPIRQGLAKAGRFLFDAADPLYQHALFLRNLDRYGGDATKAMERTRKFVQTFRSEDMPEAVLRLTGRAPGQGPVSKAAGQLFGVTFPGYPVNWVRMGYNIARERPVSGAIALATPFIIAGMSRDRLVAEGKLSPEAAKKLSEEQPLTVMYEDAEGMVKGAPIGRYGPTPNTVMDFTNSGLAFGLGSQLGARAAFAQTEDGKMPEIFGGWPARQPREAQAPGAAALRAVGELSPYSPLGRASQTVGKAVRGETDFWGEEYSWEQAVLALTIGLRPKTFHEEDLTFEERKDVKSEKDRARQLIRSGTTTEEEKERAVKVLEERIAPAIPGLEK